MRREGQVFNSILILFFRVSFSMSFKGEDHVQIK